MPRVWSITGKPEQVSPQGDGRAWLYRVERDDESRAVVVELSGTLLASAPETLPSPLDEATRTRGASELMRLLADRVHPPARLTITTGGAHPE